MSYCAFPKCNNNKKKNEKKNSFFHLPTDKNTRAIWIRILKSKRKDAIPKDPIVFDEHFAEECFDQRAELKRKYMPPGEKRMKQRKLVPGSVPSIFKCISEPAKVVERPGAAKMNRRRLVEEVECSTSSVTEEELSEPLELVPVVKDQLTRTVATQTDFTVLKKNKSVYACLKQKRKHMKVQVDCGPKSCYSCSKMSTLVISSTEEYDDTSDSGSENDGEYDISDAEDDIDEDEELSVDKHLLVNSKDLVGLTSTPLPATHIPVTMEATTRLDDTMNSSYNDEWLEKEAKRMQANDPDYTPTEELGPLKLVLPTRCPLDQQVYLVFEDNLEKLFKYCMKCGSPVSIIDKRSFQGTKVTFFMTCLSRCETRWDSQPKCSGTRGVGNLLITAAGEMSGISYPKLKRFAYLLNMPFIEKTTYFRL
ncbi:uncharacterized protein LOC130662676 [Hydractinia symbiolongicarpus]|uniref:uncharacterized protein LOC130662676 n=1 Tax=Hydractinia symbiolongicarpus TaxID=13093 RepID=UPI00254BDC55|nr:uncharacterized protein LOC130662676 [Hydractinia symbiolongicarpus]